MFTFRNLIFLPFSYISLSAAVAGNIGANSTFDVFKYVDQLIGTNDYGEFLLSTAF